MAMPYAKLTRDLIPRELKLIDSKIFKHGIMYELVKKRKEAQACPKCASLSQTRYGKCSVIIRDQAIRDRPLFLKIQKHRYYCKNCRKPFTESVEGIYPRRRTTQRFRKAVLKACGNYLNLSKVSYEFKCSSYFVHQIFYEQLEVKLRERKGALWPEVLGIDEHFFSRSKGFTEFVTVFSDMRGKKLFEMALGKNKKALIDQLNHIEGRENVRLVVMDLSNGYKSFVKEFFPNARIVADKFHTLRLLTPALLRTRKEIEGHRQDLRTRKLLLCSREKLDYFVRSDIDRYLRQHPKLEELYRTKERLHTLFRTKGYERAKIAFFKFTDFIKNSKLEEVQRLRKTLLCWRYEILNYFKTRLTNALTEAFNGIAKRVQLMAYGFKNFKKYRLRCLSACS
jgi:transposase